MKAILSSTSIECMVTGSIHKLTLLVGEMRNILGELYHHHCAFIGKTTSALHGGRPIWRKIFMAML